jgi:hypothetical protein
MSTTGHQHDQQHEVLEDLPRGVDAGLRASKILVAVVAAIAYFVALMAALGLLRRLGLPGGLIDVVMYLAIPGLFLFAGAAAIWMERLQERRLRAALLPTAQPSSGGLSAGGSPTGVPVQVADKG